MKFIKKMINHIEGNPYGFQEYYGAVFLGMYLGDNKVYVNGTVSELPNAYYTHIYSKLQRRFFDAKKLVEIIKENIEMIKKGQTSKELSELMSNITYTRTFYDFLEKGLIYENMMTSNMPDVAKENTYMLLRACTIRSANYAYNQYKGFSETKDRRCNINNKIAEEIYNVISRLEASGEIITCRRILKEFPDLCITDIYDKVKYLMRLELVFLDSVFKE